MSLQYDSTGDTNKHIAQVRGLLFEVIQELFVRFTEHDKSKLLSPEKDMFDEFTPKLKELTYGSQEYKDTLAEMGMALSHHYSVNRHHPEFFLDGLNDMNLLDLLEMLVDWKAASLRHKDGDIIKSIEINGERFMVAPQLERILINTIRDFGWDEQNIAV